MSSAKRDSFRVIYSIKTDGILALDDDEKKELITDENIRFTFLF
jgi:hypothetical protein